MKNAAAAVVLSTVPKPVIAALAAAAIGRQRYSAPDIRAAHNRRAIPAG